MSLLHYPAVVNIYGPSGTGKTTDTLFTFPRGFFIATPAALKPSANVVGWEIPPQAIFEAPTVAAATVKIGEVGKLRDRHGEPFYDAVVADDFTFLAEQSISALERKLSGYKLWGALRDEVLAFRDATRRAGLHVVTIAHETGPRTYAGAFIRGGPRLPGRLPEDFPAACDLVLRAAADPNRVGWAVCYRCTERDPSYVSKDRHGVTPDQSPLNLGEILRAAGYRLRRAPGLDWIDAIAETIALSLLERPGEEQRILQNAANHVRTNITQNLKHVRWALRDGRDRALLRAAMRNPLAAYGVAI